MAKSLVYAGLMVGPVMKSMTLNGQWQGYFDQGVEELFFTAPLHKVVELETAADYYDSDVILISMLSEVPDAMGTHAVLSDDGFTVLR